MRCRRIHFAPILLGILLISCGGEGGPRADSLPGDGSVAVDTELDCVRRDYPCTWAEIEPEVLDRTTELSRRALAQLRGGEPTPAVARSLESEPDVAEVRHDGLLIRFRLDAGRAVWIGSPDAFNPGVRGAGAGPNDRLPTPPETSSIQARSRKADPVGEQKPGDRTEKSVLFLDPYRWEFKLDVFDRLIEADVDASYTLPRLFGGTRDYKCTAGQPCDCPGGRCFDYRGNDWAGLCLPTGSNCRISYDVTLDDFRSWKDYDVIHVATHGYRVCDDDGNDCNTALASGLVVPDDLKSFSEQARAPTPDQLYSWIYEAGVELVVRGDPHDPGNPLFGIGPGHCTRLTPGTPGYADAHCDETGDLWRVVLTIDFFKAAYGVGDLEDKVIYLAACTTHAPGRDAIPNYLAGANRENAVIGWNTIAKNSQQSIAATGFYTAWLKGKTAYEALQEVQRDNGYASLDFRGDRSVMRGGTSSQAPAELPTTAGVDRKRGVETVYLLDPATGVEVVDEGVLPLTTRPGDGQPDTLDALIEVVAVDDEEDPAEFVLRARVDGRDAPMTVRFNEDLGDGVHRFRGVLDLGVDLAPDTPMDVEVSADLPDGGETRWMYYDVEPGGTCVWSATVGGATPAGGAIGGRWGGAGLVREGIGNPLGIDAWPGEGDPDDHFPPGPWLVIRLENRAYHDLSDMAAWREINLAIPAAPPGTLGTFRRIPAALWIGEAGFAGNAQYLRRDVIGIPGGTGIGDLFTTDVTLTRNDTAVVEGTFQARFLDEDRIPDEPYARRPVGVGIHDFPDAEIRVSGEFRVAAGTECRTRVRRPSRLRRP